MDSMDCDMAREVWFRNPEVVECWKSRGTQVLRDLGIDVIGGSKQPS